MIRVRDYHWREVEAWELRTPCRCHYHMIPKGRGWQFNGNYENPSFTPSMNETCEPHWRPLMRCHFVVTDGKIAYCDDTTHSLAGLTLELLEVPYNPEVHGEP